MTSQPQPHAAQDLATPFNAAALERVRSHFPALRRTQPEGPRAGEPLIFLDNPAGSQVPQACIDALGAYLASGTANCHGNFSTSAETDRLIGTARRGMANFLGARGPQEIVFGPNMTTLTYSFSRALGRQLQAGDEVLVTDLDHDANISPWLALQERGVVVKRARVRVPECELDLEDLAAQLTARTRLVAVGYASNATGTINPLPAIVSLARRVGARVWVDAVHYAPHGLIDVAALGIDFLVCSAYKFFGPHVGVLWGRGELLDGLEPYQVRPAPKTSPEKFETGTKSHEGIAGLLGTLQYLGTLGNTLRDGGPQTPAASAPDVQVGGASASTHASGPSAGAEPTRAALETAFGLIAAQERHLTAALLDGLSGLKGVTLYGPRDIARQVPTVAFNLAGHSAGDVTQHLARHGIFSWAGDYYAFALMERLGLRDRGGAVRIGAAHYNTLGEIEQLIRALERLS